MKPAESRSRELQDFNLPDSLRSEIENLVNANDYEQHHEAKLNLTQRGEKILPYLHILLKSDHAVTRRESAKILKLLKNTASVAKMIPLLRDPVSEIRWIAADTLIETGKESIRPLLQALIEHPSSLWLRRSAHRILAELSKQADTHQFDNLIQALDPEDEVPERIPVLAKQALRNISST